MKVSSFYAFETALFCCFFGVFDGNLEWLGGKCVLFGAMWVVSGGDGLGGGLEGMFLGWWWEWRGKWGVLGFVFVGFLGGF